MDLAQVPVGATATIVGADAHPRRRRLAELGLRPGATVRVLHRSAGGGRVLAVGALRIAVDRPTLRLVDVIGPADA